MRLSINVEIIIILIIIFVIIFYSCAKPNTPYMLLEGFTNAAKNAGLKPIIKTKVTPNQNNKEAFSNKSYHNNSDDDDIFIFLKKSQWEQIHSKSHDKSYSYIFELSQKVEIV